MAVLGSPLTGQRTTRHFIPFLTALFILATLPTFATPPAPPNGLTLYSIGDPTPPEQLYLEYMNRARADPAADGLRFQTTTNGDLLFAYSYFGVNLTLMQADHATIPPTPPLSFNSKLMAAARRHTGDMYTNAFQGHTGSDFSTTITRITDTGYNYQWLGENLYCYAKYEYHGHAGFAVDWGPYANGMLYPAVHRTNIHFNAFKEAGVGVINGTNGSFGPQFVTQDFGAETNTPAFITGVAYYDLDGNAFYSLGEGLPDVTVLVNGSPYYAVTAPGGGYSVPVITNGNYVVEFQVNGLPSAYYTTTVAGASVKQDHIPTYTAPTITGPDTVYTGEVSQFTFTPIGGVTGYRWRQNRLQPYVTSAGAESGLPPNLVVNISTGYTGVSTATSATGVASFWLTQPDFADQYLTFTNSFKPGSGSQLTFAQRFGWSTSNQVARVQRSIDDGASWQTIWSYPGVGPTTGFVTQVISLNAYAGVACRFRLVYDYTSGPAYAGVTSIYGWYIDNIAFSNVQEVIDQQWALCPDNHYDFTPLSLGDYDVSVQAQLAGNWLPYGPTRTLTALPPPMRCTIDSLLPTGGTTWQMDFQVANETSTQFRIDTTTALTNSWTPLLDAQLNTLVSGALYRFSWTGSLDTCRFYRIGLNN